MASRRAQFAFFSLFLSLFTILFGILILDSAWAEKPEINSRQVDLLGELNKKDSLFLLSKDLKDNSEDTNEIIFPEIKADFAFNAVGLKWKKENKESENFKFYLKTENTDWILAEKMEDAAKKENDYLFTDPIFIEGGKVQVKLIDSQINTSEIELIYFDSSRNYVSPLRSVSELTQKITSNNSKKLNIISREDWGANENYRFWDPDYSEVKSFVVHHTAGGDGGDDPSATVRAIYYWHAVVLGWGDVGYNYLIDGQGNIYEGRYGGDKTIGAHTYNSIDDVNYNEGTVGIAVLGCFEDEKEGCSEVSTYNKNIKKSLSKLIAYKAADLNISLSGKRNLLGKSVASVVGHGALDYTLCPGSVIRNKLPNIRKDAHTKYKNVTNQNQYKAKLITHDFGTAYFVDTENNINITYKNNGDYNLESSKVFLKLYNTKTKEIQKIYLDSDLAVDGEYSFNYNWLADTVGEQSIITRLYRNKKYITGSKSIIKVRVDNHSQAKLKKNNLPVAVLKEWNPKINLIYKNIGITDWTKNNVYLYVNNKKITTLKEAIVKSKEKGNFEFDLQTIKGLKKGENSLIIKLKIADRTVQYSRFIHNIRLD